MFSYKRAQKKKGGGEGEEGKFEQREEYRG